MIGSLSNLAAPDAAGDATIVLVVGLSKRFVETRYAPADACGVRGRRTSRFYSEDLVSELLECDTSPVKITYPVRLPAGPWSPARFSLKLMRQAEADWVALAGRSKEKGRKVIVELPAEAT